MKPIVCPFCTQYTLEPLLKDITLTARIDGESVVSGVMAYRCAENSHVFFVRKLDVDAADPELLEATGTESPVETRDERNATRIKSARTSRTPAIPRTVPGRSTAGR